MTNDMIINLVSEQKEESEEEKDEVCTEVVKKMTHTEGLNAIKTALRFVEQQEDTTPADLFLLRCLRNMAAKKRGTAIKQKTVKDFLMKVYIKQFIIIFYELQTAPSYYPSFRLSEVALVHIASDNRDCTVL
jgi:hypothetical protein